MGEHDTRAIRGVDLMGSLLPGNWRKKMFGKVQAQSKFWLRIVTLDQETGVGSE